MVGADRGIRYVLRFVPLEHRAHLEYISDEIHHVLGRYLRGQLVLIALMSAVTFVALEWLFRLPYALWVAILTGILEIIPLIGPITAGAIACTVGFSQVARDEGGLHCLGCRFVPFYKWYYLITRWADTKDYAAFFKLKCRFISCVII